MKTLILLLVMTFLISNKIYSQWESLDGPFGGDVICFTSDGSNFFAGTNGAGIYKSTDLGLSWFPVNSGLNNLFINSLIFSESVLYASTIGPTIYKTTNGGLNWTVLASFTWGENVSTSMSIYSSRILLTTKDILYTNDYGNNWYIVINDLYRTELKQTSAIIYSYYYVGRYGEGIYRSTNLGQNWVAVNNGLSNLFINSIINIGNILYACTNGGIFKSTDMGQNWVDINAGLTDLKILSLSGDGINFFAASKTDGIFRSTNTGNFWFQTNLHNKYVKSVFNSGSLILAGVYNEGIIRSSNSGNNWFSIDTFKYKPAALHLSKINNRIYCATSGCGIFKSSDLGVTWNESNNGLISLYVNKIVFDEKYQFAATNGTGVFRSSDEGENWIPINSGRNRFNVSDIFVQNGELIAGTGNWDDYNEVLISSNSGQNWEFLLPQTELIIKTTFLKNDDKYIGGRAKNFGGIYKTTNSGLNWRRVLADFPLYMTSYDSIFYAGANYGAYMSTNNGNNWSNISNGLPGAVNFIVKHSNILYSSIYDGYSSYGYGIYRSTNLGLNWYSFNEGFNLNHGTTSLLEMDDYLFTSTINNGLWKRPITVTNINSIENNNVFGFSLSQNYPNPFNPNTNIRYEIPQNNIVTIKVYDITGKEVVTLVNEFKNAGWYIVSFNALNLSSGIYYYKIEAGDFKSIKKMLLIK